MTEGPIEQTGEGGGIALLVGVRAGRNKDFDRLVFDFEGPIPGVRVQYVDRLNQDG